MPNNLTIRVAGEGGEGVISTGEMLTACLARTRHDVFTFRTYPAEIKGGPAMLQVRCGNHPVLSQGSSLDILLCFNEENLALHGKDLKKNREGVLLYDSDSVDPGDRYPEAILYGVPMIQIATAGAGSKLAKNVVGLSVVCRLMDLPKTVVQETVKERFGHKGEAVLSKNFKAIDLGYDWAEKHPLPLDVIVPSSVIKERKVCTSGNEAMGIGAIYAGCRYYAGYPITPASDLLEFMEKHLPRFGGICIQTEDEIAAITSCIGASFAGAKAMTATSGPGFSLMVEALGLASMVEVPLVIVDAQRAGPSTGMPTKMAQGDLLMAIHAGHGDAPRVVMSPATVKDCFYGMIKAFNIAEKYQIPVVFLSDQSLSHRTQTYTKPKLDGLEVASRELFRPNGEKFRRFQITETGVSPTAVPGMPKTQFQATGLEHDESGAPNYTPAVHYRMTQKRHRKLDFIAKEKGFTRAFGDPHAQVGILSWGSTEGPIEEAVVKAAGMGYEVKCLQVKMVHPLPDEEIREFLAGVKHLIVPECNYTGQFNQIIRSRYLVETDPLLKCAGTPFFPEEILRKIESVCQKARNA